MSQMKLLSSVNIFFLLYIIIIGFSLEPWMHMCAIAIMLFFICKCYSLMNIGLQNSKNLQNTNANTYNPLTIKQTLLYLFCWVGMQPKDFMQQSNNSLNNNHSLLLQSALNISFAFFCIKTAELLFPSYWLAQAWLICIAIAFFLHFGLFSLLSYLLRAYGFKVDPIMQNPIATRSITEFWGKRWNRAFKQLITPLIYIPCKEKFGVEKTIFICFLFSGLIHELVISLPAQAGWGLPTLYFLLQAFGILMEKKFFKINLNHKNIKKRKLLLFSKKHLQLIFSYSILVLPAFFLFHPAFMKNIILPLARALGISV